MRMFALGVIVAGFAACETPPAIGEPLAAAVDANAPPSEPLPSPVPPSCAPRPGTFIFRWRRTSGGCAAEVYGFVEVTDYAHAVPVGARAVRLEPLGSCEANATYEIVWETGGVAQVAEHVVWQFDGRGANGEVRAIATADGGACTSDYHVAIWPADGT